MKKSFSEIFVDIKLLHEPITRDMLCHEPYTPESVDSHSPMPEKNEPSKNEPSKKFVSPTQLKSRLEELSKSPRLMKRSTSENVDMNVDSTRFRTRAMSEVPTKNHRLLSVASRGSLHRLQSHHSSSSESWYESDKDDILDKKFCCGDDETIQQDYKVKVKRKKLLCTSKLKKSKSNVDFFSPRTKFKFRRYKNAELDQKGRGFINHHQIYLHSEYR
ncbi:unnamed protein product [Brassicogethes aeneus]|uniref:Uncharacterized protein n=1 Tax=Brassicogethes aeneus TaxID=1431903 RepID=A0A9P0B2H9_BRAAE|nr:unnamed protein product [Brassicogethes aeneus]